MSGTLALKDVIRNQKFCKLSGFHRGVVEAFALLGCYAVLLSSWLTAFRHGLWQDVKQSILECVALEEETDRPSRNVGRQLSTNAAYHPKRAKD
jgi:hypothetical protein